MSEELIADIVGDEFTQPEFWKELAADQPSGFRKVIAAVLSFLDRTIARITKVRPFGTDLYLSDLQASRAAVVDVMRQFSGAEVGTVDDTGAVNLSIASDEEKQFGPDYSRLAGRTVAYPVAVQETGETATVTTDAQQLMRDYDGRIAAMTKLLKCLG